MKNRTITVKSAPIAIVNRQAQDYISLTDMVRHFEGGSALIEQWLKNKDTVLFLGVWEQLNNPGFNSPEFEGIKNEAGRNSVICLPRSGSRPPVRLDSGPKPDAMEEPLHTKTLPLSLVPGSVRSSSCTSLRNSSDSRMRKHALRRWNGVFSVRCPR